MIFLKPYLAGLFAFLLIDFIWLKYIAIDFYRSNIGHLMADKPNLAVAGLFYLFYVAGVVVLAVNPAIEKQQWLIAALYGGLIGFIAYGTYDITNLATLKDFPPVVAVVDIVWGTLLTATVATFSYFVTAALR